MSAYSTINITRDKALVYLISQFPSIYDHELEEILNILLRDRLYNVRITDKNDSDVDYILS